MEKANFLALLLGAGLTLAATLVVQILVVPFVQGRTRQRERWETDVIALRGLLDEQLPPAIDRYQHDLEDELTYKALRAEDDLQCEVLERAFQSAISARREAELAMQQVLDRIEVLAMRVMRRRPKAPYWGEFQQLDRRLRVGHVKVTTLTFRQVDVLDSEAWSVEWKPLKDARKALLREVNELSLTMKPPTRQLLRSARQWIRRRHRSSAPEGESHG